MKNKSENSRGTCHRVPTQIATPLLPGVLFTNDVPDTGQRDDKLFDNLIVVTFASPIKLVFRVKRGALRKCR